MYRIGELDERITLRRYTQTQDEYGTLQESAEDYAECWAHIRPRSANERLFADAVESTIEYLVVIRHRSDVTTDDTVIWRERPLNIRAVHDRGPRAGYLELTAEAGVAI